MTFNVLCLDQAFGIFHPFVTFFPFGLIMLS